MPKPPELTSAERKALRGQAMALQPAVIVGKAGPSPAVTAAVAAALARDGLVKIRLEAPDRALRAEWLEQVAAATGAAVCGAVGRTASLFRPRAPESGPRRASRG